jgi:hypothetical protein
VDNITWNWIKRGNEIYADIISRKISPDDIERFSFLIPFEFRAEMLSHLNALFLNTVVNPEIYGYGQDTIDLAIKCRSITKGLIDELRDPNYIQISRDKKLQQIL